MTTILDIPTDWHLGAACGPHPNPRMWSHATTADSADALAAKRICEGCPVRLPCGRTAVLLDERSGIHAAFHTATPTEWRELRVWLGVHAPTGQRPTECHAASVIVTCACGEKVESRSGRTVTKLGKPVRCRACSQDLVPVAQTLERVREVYEEKGEYRATAIVLGVGPEHVRNILHSGQKYVKRTTAQTILGIEIAKAC